MIAGKTARGLDLSRSDADCRSGGRLVSVSVARQTMKFSMKGARNDIDVDNVV